jgi:hypothetical protein
MSPSKITQSSFGSRTADLVALTISFLIFVSLMDIQLTTHILLDLVIYVSVVFVCLRFARRLIFDNLLYSKRLFKVLLGNIFGLLAGAVLLVIGDLFLPFISQSVIVVIFSSILAFFILGTLSPLIKSSDHDKIIHH